MSRRATELTLVSFVALLAGACSCHGEKRDPAASPPSAVVQDFERDLTLKRWPKDAPGAVRLSTAWAADGRQSLEIGPGMMASFSDLGVADWTGYGVLRFTVHNPGARTAGLGLEIQDRHDAFDERHQHSFGAPPGDHVIELDLSAGLWRGEEGRPYRGALRSPLDLTKITRLSFTNEGATPLWVDRVEVARVLPLATPGGFAFDFGREGKQVMADTTAVFPSTAYAPGRGHGFLGPVGEGMRAMSYPTPLLGDGLPLGPGFQVDLPGGRYLGWIAFERGGFFEDEQCRYARADVRVNGVTVTGHDFGASAAHFLFEDTELTDLSQIEERLVRPAHAITRFRFEAAPGANVFSLAVTGEEGPPLRVAGLMLAPDTPEGAAYLDAHEERQRRALAVAYPPQDLGRRGGGRAAPARDLVAEPLALGAQLYPRDWPVHAEGADPGEVDAFGGHVAAMQLAVYTGRALTVHVEVGPLAGPGGAVLAPPVVRHGRYLPTRPLGNGPVRLEISHYRPEPEFPAGPDLARAVLFEWSVPEGAAAGAYAGEAALTADGVTLRVPLRVRVHAVTLPPVPIPVGLLMSALPFGPEAVGEDRWWALQAAVLDEQTRAGLTCVTGGPGLGFRAGARAVAGERALFYLALARVRGPLLAVVNYGGFFPQLRLDPEAAAAFVPAWTAFAAAHELPPFYFSSYDEPSTPAELEVALGAAEPLARGGLHTLGFLTRPRRDALGERLLDATYAPALGAHEVADLRDLAARGKHPWAYNAGMDRWAMGLQLWRGVRAGVEGRLQWIGMITQGFAFDDLDGREPATSAWLVHDRLGAMPTPRWLSAREGLVDLRVRLALEAAVPAGDAALAVWPAEGYGKDRERWSEAALDAARAAMLARLDEGR